MDKVPDTVDQDQSVTSELMSMSIADKFRTIFMQFCAISSA